MVKEPVFTIFNDRGANASATVKASVGRVFSLQCHNENAATRYIQLHNLAAALSGTEVPVISIPIGADENIIIGTEKFTQWGLKFSVGITFGFSTTKDTYTAGTAGEHSTEIIYR